MVKDRRVLILYSTAVCNLKCTYCFIDKNPALVKIDNILHESFQGDYYFDFAKEVFPDPEQLTEIQIWGGEPTLNFHRISEVMKKIINHYPNIHELMFSTNLAHDNAVDEIFYLLSEINKCSREITLSLQLSLDGPTYINDTNRGIGVTERFSKNFSRLIAEVDSFLSKNEYITIRAFNKSTLDIASIESLQSKEKIIKYFKFLEAYQNIAENSKHPRFEFNATVPNTACPLPITVDLGKKFANLCKLTREVMEENSREHYFKYYQSITPFDNGNYKDIQLCNKGCCGTGKICVGLLPNRLISTCHNGFTEVLSTYKQYAIENAERVSTLQNAFFSDLMTNDMVFPYEKLANYEQQIEEFYNNESKNVTMTLVGQIQLLAAAGQIDAQYKKINKAIEGALFILSHTSYCVRDNLNTSGTKTITPPNLIKLLLNGAKEYIEDFKDEEDKEN